VDRKRSQASLNRTQKDQRAVDATTDTADAVHAGAPADLGYERVDPLATLAASDNLASLAPSIELYELAVPIRTESHPRV